jgi:hypothetical protein
MELTSGEGPCRKLVLGSDDGSVTVMPMMVDAVSRPVGGGEGVLLADCVESRSDNARQQRDKDSFHFGSMQSSAQRETRRPSGRRRHREL